MNNSDKKYGEPYTLPPLRRFCNELKCNMHCDLCNADSIGPGDIVQEYYGVRGGVGYKCEKCDKGETPQIRIANAVESINRKLDIIIELLNE